jgi:hypothetical protein
MGDLAELGGWKIQKPGISKMPPVSVQLDESMGSKLWGLAYRHEPREIPRISTTACASSFLAKQSDLTTDQLFEKLLNSF